MSTAKQYGGGAELQCEAKSANGSRCRASAIRAGRLCHLHAQPGRAAAIGAAGGRRRAVTRSRNLKVFRAPANSQELQKIIGQTVIDCRTGDLDPRVGNTTAILASAFIKALETSSLEERVSALEAAQRELRKSK